MILRSVKVSGWRCYANTVEVGPFAEGINIIHAPNANGKSTLFEAMLRAFFDSHRVSGQGVQEIRPWGRELAPEVAVEFSSGGAEYRVIKRFIDRPGSELLRKEGAVFTRLAEGDPADDKVRELLLGKASGRGLCGSAHQGICQVLWTPQGGISLEALSDDMVSNIHRSLGVQVAGGREVSALEKNISARYHEYYSPKGRLKTGQGASRIPSLEKQFDDERDKRAGLLAAVAGFEEASRAVEDLRATRRQARRTAEQVTEQLKTARQAASAYAALASRRSEQAQKVESASARHSELKHRVDALAGARRERREAAERLSGLREARPARVRERAEREAEVASTRFAREEIRKDRQKVDDAQSLALKARRYVEDGAKHAELAAKLSRIGLANKELKERSDERNAVVAPDAKAMRRVRKAVKDRDEARVLLDASLVTLEITPEKEARMSVAHGEEPGDLDLSAGVPHQVKGAPEVMVDIEGLARVRAWGPESNVDELKEKIAHEERLIEEQTRQYGTSDIHRLEALQERAKELDTRVDEARTVVETLLDGSGLEEIEQERARAAVLVEELSAENEGWREGPPDPDALEARALDIKNRFVGAVEEAEAKADAAQQALAALETTLAVSNKELEVLEERLTSLAGRLEELESDGMDDAGRAAKLTGLALEWDAAKAALEKADGELGEYAADPALEVEILEKSLKAAELSAEKALEKEKSEEGRLQQLASEGNYSRLNALEEQVQSLSESLERERTRAAALKLLHDTVEGCRTEALLAVARPVEEVATRFMRRIAGPGMGGLRVSENFAPCAVEPLQEGVADVGVGNLSGGEQEQVHLAVRLALAQVLAAGERQLVVLDDVLTATDTGRFARIIGLLEELESALQLLILTCHPEKYGAMTDARFFDLREIIAASR